MANIGSAAKVVEMELMHARQGMQYYAKLVENLEGVLQTLSSLDTPSKGGTETTRATKHSRAKQKTTIQQNVTSVKKAKRSSLPSTGKDFWSSLLTDTPQTAAEVFSAAISTIGIRPNAEEKKKLTQRMSNALSVMAKNGDIKAEGKRRERRYSRQEVIH
jgi:hypothetical protein